MHNELIRAIKARRMSLKQATYFLVNVANSARVEREIATCDLSNSPILTNEEIAELEEIVRFYTDRLFAAKKAARILGIQLSVKDIHWVEDDYVPMAI